MSKDVIQRFMYLDGQERIMVVNRSEKGLWPVKRGTYNVDVYKPRPYRSPVQGYKGALAENIISSTNTMTGGAAERSARRKLIANGRLVA